MTDDLRLMVEAAESIGAPDEYVTVRASEGRALLDLLDRYEMALKACATAAKIAQGARDGGKGEMDFILTHSKWALSDD